MPSFSLLRWPGSEFHTVGPAMENVHLPSVLRWQRCISSWRRCAECSRWRPAASETATQQSAWYFGASSCRWSVMASSYRTNLPHLANASRHRSATFSTSCSLSVTDLGGSASTMLQQFTRAVTKTCIRASSWTRHQVTVELVEAGGASKNTLHKRRKHVCPGSGRMSTRTWFDVTTVSEPLYRDEPIHRNGDWLCFGLPPSPQSSCVFSGFRLFANKTAVLYLTIPGANGN